MNEFNIFLKKEQILNQLVEHYNLKPINDRLLTFIEDILIKLPDFSGQDIDNDLIGTLYQQKINQEEKKVLGEFYTPRDVVDYILNALDYTTSNNIENKKIIDISCGSGSFLIQSARTLTNRLLKKLNLNSWDSYNLEELNRIINTIQKNIYGIDINPIACILCQINIHFTLFPLYQRMSESEIGFKAPIFRIFCKNAFSLIKEGMGLVKHDNLFDFVVGNPPYLFIRDISSEQRFIIENSNFITNKGQYDYYQIFIELGIKLLKNQGKLGYIVPDSILALSNRLIIRKYIYNTTKIKEIYYTGPKFDDPVVSNIILILEKENNNLERKKNAIRTKLSDRLENQILQKILEKWDFKFLIHLNDIDISIIEHLNNNFPKLKDLNKKEGFKISICRGVELAKTGEIIYCNRCKMYFPVPKKHLLCPKCKSKLKRENLEKIIRDEIPDDKKEDFKSFLYSINRYQIKNNKYIDVSKKGINYKDLNIYKDRIIIRQLSQNNLICATYDTNFSLTSQSFYNLKIHQSPIREFNHYYILGLINSKLLSFCFIKSFGSYKKLFPRILIEKIKALPLKTPESPEERKIAIEIIEHVKELLELNEKNQRKIGDIQDKIDSLVFDLYQISNDHREYILNFMDKL